MWPMLAMAAAGALMGNEKNKRARQIEDADRKLAAETQRYSWVTGNKADPIRRAGSSWMDMGQGAMAGGMFGQQLGGASKPAPEAAPDAAGLNRQWMDPSYKSDGGGSYWQQLEKERQRQGMTDAMTMMG